jgi:hypothetical protein
LPCFDPTQDTLVNPCLNKTSSVMDMKTARWIALIFVVMMSLESASASCPAAPAGYKGYGQASFPPGEGRTVAPGGLKLTAPKDSFANWASDASVIDAWTCTSFRFPETSPAANLAGGIVFWRRDAQNFYLALVRRNGSFATYRHTAAGWTNLREGSIGALNPGTSNQIEVVTLGDIARVFINDRSVMEIGTNMGASPLGVGIYAEAGPDEAASWLIESVSIISLCHSNLAGYC